MSVGQMNKPAAAVDPPNKPDKPDIPDKKMPKLPKVQLARAIMQMIKTDEVVSIANYANVELVTPPIAIKYADAFYAIDGPQLFDEQDPPQPRDPTNEEKAAHYRKVLRQFHRDRLNAVRSLPVGEAAKAAETLVVDAEVDSDLGTE